MIKETFKQNAHTLELTSKIMDAFNTHKSIKFPKLYNLGKQSVYMQCKWCGLKPTHYIDALNIKDRGICFRCDELSAEYYHDAFMEGGAL